MESQKVKINMVTIVYLIANVPQSPKHSFPGTLFLKNLTPNDL
jgi:hypothetical protein